MVLTLLSAWAGECPSPTRALTLAETDLSQFNLAAVDEEIKEAVKGFGCAELATPEDAARLHLVAAHRLLWGGDSSAAALAALASARAAAPDVWPQRYGDEHRATWAAAAPAGLGTVRLAGLDEQWSVYLDGREIQTDAPLPAGPHLLQVASGLEVYWAVMVKVIEGEQATLSVPADARPPTVVASLPEPQSEPTPRDAQQALLVEQEARRREEARRTAERGATEQARRQEEQRLLSARPRPAADAAGVPPRSTAKLPANGVRLPPRRPLSSP